MSVTGQLELTGVGLDYQTENETVHALREIDLRIDPGEFVSIVGPSGSGKSTLLNVLGCLDQPTAGHYRVGGVDIAAMSLDELAELRRATFGFVFQRYNLLPKLDTLRNVALPALYAGVGQRARHRASASLLERFGLADRLQHRPPQLSGGQQQRVSIARALTNGAQVLLADEPTGALDTQTGRDVLELLRELNSQGLTIIIVTHDLQVAAAARRVIRIEDGRIVEDSGSDLQARPATSPVKPAHRRAVSAWWTEARHAWSLALSSLWSHRLRSALSISGIAIGIAAVVTISALGDAVQARLEDSLRDVLAGRIQLSRGHPELPEGAPTLAFDRSDVQLLKSVAGVRAVVPQLRGSVAATSAMASYPLSVTGIGPGELSLQSSRLLQGREIGVIDAAEHRRVVVINKRARDRLFKGMSDVLGQTLRLGDNAFEVIGVSGIARGAFGEEWQDRVFIPASTFQSLVSVSTEYDSLTLKLHEGAPAASVQSAVSQVLLLRHRGRDFTVTNGEEALQDTRTVVDLLRLVLGSIASISLFVGGVGVMNMMLVSISERTKEIGIRMAIGARPSDIQLQFLVEAACVCLVGGGLGLSIGQSISWVANLAQQELQLNVALPTVAMAAGASTLVGLVFGFFPARSAARMKPVDALARE